MEVRDRERRTGVFLLKARFFDPLCIGEAQARAGENSASLEHQVSQGDAGNRPIAERLIVNVTHTRQGGKALPGHALLRVGGMVEAESRRIRNEYRGRI